MSDENDYCRICGHNLQPPRKTGAAYCQCEKKELDRLRSEVVELTTQNQRLHDLVRRMRVELQEDGLITEQESAALDADNEAVARLETYAQLQAEVAELRKALKPFADAYAIWSDRPEGTGPHNKVTFDNFAKAHTLLWKALNSGEQKEKSK